MCSATSAGRVRRAAGRRGRGCRSGERIAFGYLVSRKFTGEQARLEVLRGGQLHTVHASLDAPQALVPLHLAGADPSFLIIAGGPPAVPTQTHTLSQSPSHFTT